MSRLDRRAVVARLLEGRSDLLVVGGLGAPTYDVAAAGDHERNFYLWGAMGGAVPIGLGLALARPQTPVLVVTGDGELLMGMGSLASVAVHAPGNLTLVVLDNARYGETGSQASHTAHRTDLAAVARGCGLADSRIVGDMAAVAELAARVHRLEAATTFANVPVEADMPDKVLPVRDGVHLKNRLRAALGLEPL